MRACEWTMKFRRNGARAPVAVYIDRPAAMTTDDDLKAPTAIDLEAPAAIDHQAPTKIDEAPTKIDHQAPTAIDEAPTAINHEVLTAIDHEAPTAILPTPETHRALATAPTELLPPARVRSISDAVTRLYSRLDDIDRRARAEHAHRDAVTVVARRPTRQGPR